MKKIIVTGGSGFIGTGTCRAKSKCSSSFYTCPSLTYFPPEYEFDFVDEITIPNVFYEPPIGIYIPPEYQEVQPFEMIEPRIICGDWFDCNGFGRVEGAIISGLLLANKLKYHF